MPSLWLGLLTGQGCQPGVLERPPPPAPQNYPLGLQGPEPEGAARLDTEAPECSVPEGRAHLDRVSEAQRLSRLASLEA